MGGTFWGALETAKRLDAAGVRIVVTTLGADLTTPAGRLVFSVLAQIAEFERELTIERVRAGLTAAKSRGQKLGRRHTLAPHQRREAARMADEGQSFGEIAALLGVGKSIVWRAVQKHRSECHP